MARSVLDQPHYCSEEAAFAYVERLLWPNGPVCPFCQSKKAGKLQGVRTKPSKKNPEGVERHGLYKCYGCRKQFTVRKGTVFEDSHLPMHLWLQVIYLVQSSKKAIGTAQVQRLLNCSMETAWFLTHRVREMMHVDARDLLQAHAALKKPYDAISVGDMPPRGQCAWTSMEERR